MFGYLISLIVRLSLFIGYQVAWLFVHYYFYLLLVVTFRILIKLKTQVYNEGSKIRPSGERAILVTGATSGIGLALSKYFYNKGFSVIACYYSNQEPGYNELKNLPKRSSCSIYFVPLDVRSEQSIASSYAQVKEILTNNGLRLYALINNAGIGEYTRTQWTSKAQVRAKVETNLLGPMLMVKQYIPLLAQAKNSRIINVSSIIRHLPTSHASIYGATKAGLSFYSISAGLDLDQYGIKMIAIHPGNLMKNTSILKSTMQELAKAKEDFSAEEKELFEEDLKKHEKIAAKTIDGIDRYQESLGKQATNSRTRSSRDHISFKTILAIASGCIKKGVNIEDSSFMDSFDNAVRMKNPPVEMFAGNKYFNIISSTLIEELGCWPLRTVSASLSSLMAGK